MSDARRTPGNRAERGSRPNVLLWLGFAVCFSAMLFQTFRFGAPTFERPRTVVSNGDAKFYEPLLIFLSHVAGAIPPGSTVSLVAPAGQDPLNWQDYILAIGQFPRQRLIFAGRFVPAGSGGEVPRFAACYQGEFADPRFRLFRRFPGGNLYEAVR